jgi:hypothetical protein
VNRSPIEAAIDAACGYDPNAAPKWKDEIARSVLNQAADSLYMANVPPYREAAALLYYGARQARGLRSERAFRLQLFAAARLAWPFSPPDGVFLRRWTRELRERQERGW